MAQVTAERSHSFLRAHTISLGVGFSHAGPGPSAATRASDARSVPKGRTPVSAYNEYKACARGMCQRQAASGSRAHIPTCQARAGAARVPGPRRARPWWLCSRARSLSLSLVCAVSLPSSLSLSPPPFSPSSRLPTSPPINSGPHLLCRGRDEIGVWPTMQRYLFLFTAAAVVQRPRPHLPSRPFPPQSPALTGGVRYLVRGCGHGGCNLQRVTTPQAGGAETVSGRVCTNFLCALSRLHEAGGCGIL